MVVKVLVVDDSGFFRRRVSEILSADSNIQVVGTATTGVDGTYSIADQVPGVLLSVRFRDPALVRGIIVRSQCFDQAVRAADLRAGSQLLTLGAGLCTRRARLAAELDAAVGWFYVDLPAVMAVRRLCLPAQDGEHDWAGSLQDTRWLHAARLCADAPHVLVLEGVLPYLPADAVRALLATIAGHFVRHGLRGQLLADFLHPARAVPSVQGGVHLPVQSGACDAAELIAGCPGLRVLAEQHPFAEFSLGHRQFAEDFLARHQRPPYTLATLALGEPDA